MSIFALSDLHLSFGTDKPMNVFGQNWQHYEEKIKSNWINLIKESDTVLICGDVSWATYLDDTAIADFAWIESLPGKKIISKGNHDYWWCTHKKQTEFTAKNNFETIEFLHNNSYIIEDNVGICGARGWLAEDNCLTDEDKKIYNRELERLKISINSIPKEAVTKIAMLHYPPDRKFMELLSKSNVGACVYGHLHGNANRNAICGELDNVKYNLTACDYLDFKPIKIV